VKERGKVGKKSLGAVVEERSSQLGARRDGVASEIQSLHLRNSGERGRKGLDNLPVQGFRTRENKFEAKNP